MTSLFAPADLPRRNGMPYSDPSLRRLKHGPIRPMPQDRTLLQRLLDHF